MARAVRQEMADRRVSVVLHHQAARAGSQYQVPAVAAAVAVEHPIHKEVLADQTELTLEALHSEEVSAEAEEVNAAVVVVADIPAAGVAGWVHVRAPILQMVAVAEVLMLAQINLILPETVMATDR
jgi:hypothetical protein